MFWLAGTCTVIVKLEDENDNAPEFVKKKWVKEVNEGFDHEPPTNQTLVEVIVTDPDADNDFAFRVSTFVSFATANIFLPHKH